MEEHSTAVREITSSLPLTPFLKLLFRYIYIPIRNVNMIKKVIKAFFMDVFTKKKEIEAWNLYKDSNFLAFPVIMKLYRHLK